MIFGTLHGYVGNLAWKNNVELHCSNWHGVICLISTFVNPLDCPRIFLLNLWSLSQKENPRVFHQWLKGRPLSFFVLPLWGFPPPNRGLPFQRPTASLFPNGLKMQEFFEIHSFWIQRLKDLNEFHSKLSSTQTQLSLNFAISEAVGKPFPQWSEMHVFWRNSFWQQDL